MKKINLYDEIIAVSNKELSLALSSNREFGITVKAEIKYAPFDKKDIFIYQGKVSPPANVGLSIPKTHQKQELLGKNYQVVEDGERVLIKAGGAWQEIIGYNVKNCHYDDTTGDGVDTFHDKELEDMGWMVTDFNVSYREIVEFFEEKADVTLLCIEQIEPYQFSGLGYLNNVEEARKLLFDFCQSKIKDKLANDSEYKEDWLDDDQREAIEFFKAR